MAIDALDAWNEATNLLELRWDRANYETWLRPTEFLQVEADRYVIGVPNSTVGEMLSQRLCDDVHQALSEVVKKEVAVEFRVQGRRRVQLADDEDMPLFRLLSRQEEPETSASGRSFQEALRMPATSTLPESAINPQMVFERFIVNESNQLAAEAARAVAEYPATVYNPFLVYGGVGIGKTHLLQAIANACHGRGMKVLYVSSEAFTNDLVQAIRNRKTAMFREKYRSVDVLLVDDIQFIRGKDSTQEEFFHTFNSLVNFNKQIVLASDRHPRELKTLEDRLRSRFQGGLVADIAPPEYETRVAIMELWAQERDLKVPMEMLQMIAQRSSSCVRELHGLFNQIAARVRIRGVEALSMRRVEASLDRYERPAEDITVSHVIEVIADSFNLDSDLIKGKKRVARINQARQLAMFLAREMTESSLPQIGELFGRSHTTILHGCNKIEAEIKIDAMLANRVQHLRNQILRV